MKIAIYGGGIVGGGVIEILNRFQDIEIKYLVVRDSSKARDFEVPHTCTVTTNVDSPLNDDSVSLVVELMGGIDTAWHVIETALKLGKHVVTANKALISKRMSQIEEILGSLPNPPFFFYEAAVCGGIPVINTLLRGMHGDEIQSILGVMNGSTNWMLDEMQKRGVGYTDLLDEAKKLGFLEADPSADVLGWDARSKLCILARIAFQVTLNEDCVACIGIDHVSLDDINFAKNNNQSVRLVARAWKQNSSVHAVVMPALVKQDHILGRLSGATNCVVYQAKHSLEHIMVGSGAGRYPTANSVVADVVAVRDIVDMGGGRAKNPFGHKESNMRFDADFSSKFYLRAVSRESLDEVHAAFRQAEITFTDVSDLALITEPCEFSQLLTAVPPHMVDIAMHVL
jgi:homoserine dehydrogenase